MSHGAKSALRFGISIVVMFVFLYFSFRGTDFGALWEILKTANYWWAMALLPCLVASHALRAWRWEYLMRPIKKEMRYRNLFSALMVGYMLNNVLPKVGEVVRPYAISKLEKVPVSAALGTVLVERIFDILSFIVTIIVIPLVYSGPLSTTFPWLVTASIWVTVATFGSFGFFIFLMMRRDITERILKFFTRRLKATTAEKVERVVHSFLDGFLFLKDTGNYVAIIALSIVLWLLYVAMMYFPFYAFKDTSSLGWGAAWVVQAISSIGIVVPTPGATGPYHYFVIETLTKLYGVDGNVAKSYAVITHAVAVVGITAIGLYYFIKDKIHITETTGADAPSAGE